MSKGRVAVVTGGASGMGEAICHELGRRGHRVAVLDVDHDAAQRVTEDLRARGVTASAVGVDVTDRRGVEAAFGTIRAELGPVAVLVTSAGLFAYSSFADITVESWQRLIDVNLTGTFHCCQVAVGDMVNKLQSLGLLVPPAGENVIRIFPALIADKAALDEGIAILEQAAESFEAAAKAAE